MSENHTPGPWIWAQDHRGLFGAGPDNDVLSYASYEGMWLSHGKSSQANALLIAAAPDMLAEMKSAAGYLRNAKIDLETGCTKATAIRTIEGGLARLEAAIAKAEGRS